MKKHFFEKKDSDYPSTSADKVNTQIETDASEEKAPETLFTKNEKSSDKKRRKGMVKAQKIMIASFACVAVVLSVIYFAWLKPQKDKLAAGEPVEPPKLLAGEAHTDDKTGIAMFPHIQMKDIKSVEVHNSYGVFHCVQAEAGTETFNVEEHPMAPISSEALSSFMVDAGYTIVERRVTEKCEDLSLYGLAESDDPSYYILTDSSNNVHKVYIGKELPSGKGYYARYDGRDVVYVLKSNTIASTVLSPATALISPILGYPMDQTAVTMLENVIMFKNGEPFINITYTDDPDDPYALSAYEMIYPANYLVNDDNYSLIMLASFAQLKGYTVLAAGSPENQLITDEALMREYGFFDIENPPYELYYNSDGILPTVIAFAPSGIDGYYFAYSYLYDIIVLIETEAVEYLDWDLIKFINSALFAEYITDVSEISVSASEFIYNGKKYNIDERFSIKYDEDNDTLDCYAYSTQKLISGTTPDVNFVQGFYGTALRMHMQGYIKSEGVDVDAEVAKGEYAKMTVKKNDGEVLEYKFYRYSERCYYTINGEGEFYLSLRDVNKLLIDAVRAAHREYVDVEEQYPQFPEGFINSSAK